MPFCGTQSIDFIFHFSFFSLSLFILSFFILHTLYKRKETEMRNIILTMLLIMLPLMASAQKRDKQLTIHVNTETADNLSGQALTVMHTDYQISYGALALDASGSCSLKVYEGSHTITIERPGYATSITEAMVNEDTEVNITLTEKVREPYAIHTAIYHDAFTAKNDVRLSWNTEAPVFFDDFEGHDAFAINFAPWTGIDVDRETAAALIGDYPNRGTLQYAQIINPLQAEPTWWYEYEVLRPCSGKQYVGFTRTMSGKANDDWLISPALTIGTDNYLSFMAKAADKYPERFIVYVTTVTDNPQTSDFQQITTGNYETVDYTHWHEMTYNLSEYSGKTIRFAIRYIGDYSHYGNFMLMVDDVFVGQIANTTEKNPNERFLIFLDGNEVATTTEPSYTLTDVAIGHHTIGIKAKYIAAETDIVTTEINIVAADYSDVTITATADSQLSPEGMALTLLNTTTTETLDVTLAATSEDGVATINIPSLPKATYIMSSEEGAFEALSKTITVDGASHVFDIVFADHIITPYNITVDVRDNNNGTIDCTARWNQELLFSDSFEEYDDFATGQFGEWLSVDNDKMPVYPIGLGGQSNIVSFPGSGTPSSPQPLAPIVFNPWHTTPAMLPTDAAIAAPTGDKSVIFFSPQRAVADKWLISPEISIREDFVAEFTAKAYSIYPETMDICVGTDASDLQSFTPIATIDELSSGEWSRYQVDLSDYEGQTVRVALHYKSYDAFFAMVDDFTIGNKDGEAMTIDYGNVVYYDVTLDGKEYCHTDDVELEMPNLTADEHTIGVKAVYKNGASEVAYYTFGIADGIKTIMLNGIGNDSPIYNLAGQKMTRGDRLQKGIYLQNGRKIVNP